MTGQICALVVAFSLLIMAYAIGEPPTMKADIQFARFLCVLVMTLSTVVGWASLPH